MNTSTDRYNTFRDHLSPQTQPNTIKVSGPDTDLRESFCLPGIRVGTAADNDVVLTEHDVSRHHLELRTTQEGGVLQDLRSRNGTFIGTRRGTEAHLDPDPLSTLGHSRLSVRQQTEEHVIPVPTGQNHLGALVGASRRMQELYGLIRAAAPTPATVLLLGESGSGKELAARTLHELSGRTGPLVVFDASVADRELINSALFGHTKGAFTGANRPRAGHFREVNGGTLFIDEIGELPLELQPRLLRALENREVIPVGADRPVPVQVRVIAATHQDLPAMVQEGRFRADLFYRLSVIPIQVPPLREIREDIPLLVKHLLHKLSLPCRLSPEAMEALMRYHWPGNVRELRNTLERAAVFCPGEVIGPEHLGLPQDTVFPAEATAELLMFPASAPLPTLKALERQVILEALARNHRSLAKTAQELAISPSTLWRKLKAFNVKPASSPGR
jgi:DNA-binding NtrC family response regulator